MQYFIAHKERIKKYGVSLFAVCCVLFGTLCSVEPVYAFLDLENAPPVSAPFMGGYFVGGSANNLDSPYVCVSANDGWTVDTDGYLFRYANTSASGVMYDARGTEYTFTCSAFSYPRYRLSSASGWDEYTTLYLTPTSGNILIENDFAPVMDSAQMERLTIVFLVGLCAVILLTRKR